MIKKINPSKHFPSSPGSHRGPHFSCPRFMEQQGSNWLSPSHQQWPMIPETTTGIGLSAKYLPKGSITVPVAKAYIKKTTNNNNKTHYADLHTVLKEFHLILAFAIFFGWSSSGTTQLSCQTFWTFIRFIA